VTPTERVFCRAADGSDPQRTASQIVIATAAPGDTLGTLSLYEPTWRGWQPTFGPVPAVFGRSGIAPAGAKREGDGRTPSGWYALTECFGYDDTIATGLRYVQVTDSDIWIDDVNHPDYNRWVQLPTTAASFEYLHRRDVLYRYAIVVDYNRDPVVAGNGSAIFIHIRRADGRPTAGCIALAETDLLQLLRRLRPSPDPHLRPQVFIESTPE
ncbi:MAG TPA: L,D-transpeptidase family protein, partial [bacterium]|nr:L,D-transpeptidase family protein [bacterium]